MFPPIGRSARMLAAAVAIMVPGGCATFSKDGGFGEVERISRDRLGKDVRWQRGDGDREGIRTAVEELLASPLSADAAVQVALLNNRGLQASFADLGIAEADLVQAGRISNPHFAYLRTARGGESKSEWALTYPLVDLLTMPVRRTLERRRFERVQLEVAGRVLDLAAETRKSWIRAVAAGDAARYGDQVMTAAEAAEELSRRMAEAGNISGLDHMRRQLFHAEAATRLGQARRAAASGRERLARLMGLPGAGTGFSLPERLPELPAEVPDLGDLEERALAQRVDILAARRDAESLAASLGLTRATRFINVLELGPAATKEDPEPWKRGFEVSLQMPIFDWGGARVAKAEALYMQALHRVAEAAVNARSEVREAHSSYLAAYGAARRYRDTIGPLRRKISEETLLRYNGMLISVFELLADAREQAAAVTASIDALRDFWIAENDLRASLSGTAAGLEFAAPAPPGGTPPDPAPAGH